jgi:hypothetical protein
LGEERHATKDAESRQPSAADLDLAEEATDPASADQLSDLSEEATDAASEDPPGPCSRRGPAGVLPRMPTPAAKRRSAVRWTARDSQQNARRRAASADV